MELYLTDRFLSAFFRYFTRDAWGEEGFSAFRQEWNALLKSLENKRDAESIQALFQFVITGSFVNEKRYEGYRRIKDAYRLGAQDMLNLFAVLFILDAEKEVPFPVRSILYDRYPEIVLEIARTASASLVFNNERDVTLFKRSVYRVLSDLVIAFCPPEDLSVWEDNDSCVIKEEDEPVQGYAMEEYEKVNCCVHVTDVETVHRIMRSSLAAAYYSTDVDGGIFLIGNFITFSTGLHSHAVTVQITGRTRFNTYEEMYAALGTDAFGYRNKTPAACAKETERLFAKNAPEGALALELKRLAEPIFTAEDFQALKNREN